MKQYRVTINGNIYEVGIEDVHASPIQVMVDGESYAVQLQEVHAGPAAVGTAARETAAGETPARPVAISLPSTPSTAPATSSDRKLVAPMPGTILSVRVSAGDAVAVGQELCVLEAMKMKNSIKSPRDGVIASVGVHEGQNVAHGTLLIEFE